MMNSMMDRLSQHIADRLQTRSYCTVFESELQEVFAIDIKGKEKMAEAIRAFAEEGGWTVTITDPGIRATFKKLPGSEL
jgi:hypothetical protein